MDNIGSMIGKQSVGKRWYLYDSRVHPMTATDRAIHYQTTSGTLVPLDRSSSPAASPSRAFAASTKKPVHLLTTGSAGLGDYLDRMLHTKACRRQG